MDDNTTKIIKDKFDALPESIKEVILSSNYEQTLLEIGNQYKLNVEQLGILERETTLVMMGLTPTKNFETELTRELNVDKLKGAQIVKDINEKIFLKIRELLKLMNTPAGEEPVIEDEEIEKKELVEAKEIKNTGVDWDVMKSAGIEIIEKPAASTSSYGAPKEEAHPILAQKLSGFTKSEVVETQHSLDNITKPARPPEPGAGGTNIPNKSTIDPYREKPE